MIYLMDLVVIIVINKVMNMIDIKKTMQTLKNQRDSYADATEMLKQRQDLFNNQNAELINGRLEIQKEITDLETTARAFALEQFELTKEPKIGYGLSIVQRKQFEYDSDKAFEWAKERGLALKLDASKFKKLAEVEELDFVSFDKKPSVNISKTIIIGD